MDSVPGAQFIKTFSDEQIIQMRQWLAKNLPDEFVKSIRKSLRDRRLKGLSSNDPRLNQPVFIWGLGRSGTFLLYDILSLHDDLVCERFPVGQKRSYKGLWGDRHWGEGNYDHLTGNLTAPVEGRWRFSGESVWLPENGNILGKNVVENIRLYYAHLFTREEGRKARRFLDKYPTYILIADLIDQVFPDAFHVWCLRDPRETFKSVLRLEVAHFYKDYRNSMLFSGMVPPNYENFYKHEYARRHLWQTIRLLQIGISSAKRLDNRCFLFHFELLQYNAHICIEQLMKSLNLSKTKLLPSQLPDQFEKMSKAHSNDSFFEETFCELLNSDDPLNVELNRLSDLLGYADKYGELKPNITVPIHIHELGIE